MRRRRGRADLRGAAPGLGSRPVGRLGDRGFGADPARRQRGTAACSVTTGRRMTAPSTIGTTRTGRSTRRPSSGGTSSTVAAGARSAHDRNGSRQGPALGVGGRVGLQRHPRLGSGPPQALAPRPGRPAWPARWVAEAAAAWTARPAAPGTSWSRRRTGCRLPGYAAAGVVELVGDLVPGDHPECGATGPPQQPAQVAPGRVQTGHRLEGGDRLGDHDGDHRGHDGEQQPPAHADGCVLDGAEDQGHHAGGDGELDDVDRARR